MQGPWVQPSLPSLGESSHAHAEWPEPLCDHRSLSPTNSKVERLR